MITSWVFLVFLLDCTSTTIGSPIVNIGSSTINGKKIYHNGCEVKRFLGIPYAQPPIGDLRFKPTKPLENFPETIDATNQPPACNQYTQNPYPWYEKPTIQSEDCLYLNIWSPVEADPNNTKAVMFWIHGGSFRFGSIRQGMYDGTMLAGLGDIVVVNVNYRVGPFGFLTSSTEDAPGNAGLWDILEGLRWVNRHIQSFGGDPDKVTLAGEGAGSVAVGLLSISPQARGLFARQIMQSGSPAVLGLDSAREKNMEMAMKLAGLTGCANSSFTLADHPAEVVECLRGLNEKEIAFKDYYVSTTHQSFLPQVGDEITPVNPRDAIASGQFECKELLIGNTKDEGSAFMTINNADRFGFLGDKKPLISKMEGSELLWNYLRTFPNPFGLTSHYLPPELNSLTSPEEVRRQVYTAIGDAGVLCPSVFLAEKCEGSVYYYLWVHRPRITPWADWMGVTHFSDVQFLFGTARLRSRERRYSQQLVIMWSNFVKYGKPTGQEETDPVWPVYTKESPQFTFLPLQSSRSEEYGRGLHSDNCDFLRPYYGF